MGGKTAKILLPIAAIAGVGLATGGFGLLAAPAATGTAAAGTAGVAGAAGSGALATGAGAIGGQVAAMGMALPAAGGGLGAWLGANWLPLAGIALSGIGAIGQAQTAQTNAGYQVAALNTGIVRANDVADVQIAQSEAQLAGLEQNLAQDKLSLAERERAVQENLAKTLAGQSVLYNARGVGGGTRTQMALQASAAADRDLSALAGSQLAAAYAIRKKSVQRSAYAAQQNAAWATIDGANQIAAVNAGARDAGNSALLGFGTDLIRYGSTLSRIG